MTTPPALPEPPLVAHPVLGAAELQRYLREWFPLFERPYEVVDVTTRGILMRLPIGPEHERPGGTVSGPTMMGLADGTAWLATLSRIGPVPLAVTSSLSISFLRKPDLSGHLWAHGDLLRLGRRQSVTDVRLVSGEAHSDHLVAQATVTYTIPA